MSKEVNQEKIIAHLRTFFRVSNAAFEMGRTVAAAFSGVYNPPSEMHLLHKQALEEIEKINPNIDLVMKMIHEMEKTVVK